MHLQAMQGQHRPMDSKFTHLCLECRYELQHLVRTHMGSDDESYSCIFQQEDSEGNKGVKLDKVHPPCCRIPASIASGSAVSNSPHFERSDLLKAPMQHACIDVAVSSHGTSSQPEALLERRFVRGVYNNQFSFMCGRGAITAFHPLKQCSAMR